MWFGLINEIKFWFVRTFKMRNCWMPKGDVSFSWSDDEIPLAFGLLDTAVDGMYKLDYTNYETDVYHLKQKLGIDDLVEV